MPYFDETQDQYARMGKVVGDMIAALIYLGVIALMLNNVLRFM